MSARAQSPQLRTLVESTRVLFARFPAVAVAYVFGSVARGEARPWSDLDIGVVFTRGASLADRASTLNELASVLPAAASFDEVDVVDLEAQGYLFAHRALADGFKLYEGDAERRVDFESETTIRALDFLPTYRIASANKIPELRRWLRELRDARAN